MSKRAVSVRIKDMRPVTVTGLTDSVPCAERRGEERRGEERMWIVGLFVNGASLTVMYFLQKLLLITVERRFFQNRLDKQQIVWQPSNRQYTI